MIAHTCPHCGAKLEIPDEYVGQRGGCKQCGGKFTVPAKPKKKPPPSERQLEYLRALGATEPELRGIDVAAASKLINDYKTKQRLECPECRQMIDSDSNYCMWCGEQVNDDLDTYQVLVKCRSKEMQQAVMQMLEDTGDFGNIADILEKAQRALGDD